jgi:hypothetical protein
MFNHSHLNQTASNNIRTTWITLPPEYGTVSASLIVEAPWVVTENSRAVVGCSIDARWTNENIETGSIAARVSASGDIKEFKGYIGTSGVRNPAPTLQGSSAYSEFRPVLKSPSSRRITLNQNWLDILTPLLSLNEPGLGRSKPNTLESILTSICFPATSQGRQRHGLVFGTSAWYCG